MSAVDLAQHKRKRPEPDPGGAAEQLRDLIRDAHAAAKDLHAAIKEARQVAETARDLAFAAVDDQLRESVQDLQDQMNRNCAALNAAVIVARQHIVNALTMAELIPSEDMKTLTIRWGGPLFDPDAQVKEER